MNTMRRTILRPALSAALMVLLAACGGGGGGSGTPPPPNVAVTAANQQPVARAAVVGAVSGPISGFTGVASGGSASPLAVKRLQSVAQTARKRIAEDVSADFCPGGGQADASVADREPFGVPSPGDVVTVSFNACDDGVGSVANGSLQLTITTYTTTVFAFDVATSNLSVLEKDTGVLASLDGSFSSSLRDTGTGSISDFRVANQLAASANGGGVVDDFTFLSDYVSTTTYTSASSTASTVTSGPVASADAGGFVRISTPSPLLQTSSEIYPHAGVLLATGLTGKLRLTVLSNTQVRVELDANDDGTYELSQTVLWTDLL